MLGVEAVNVTNKYYVPHYKICCHYKAVIFALFKM